MFYVVWHHVMVAHILSGYGTNLNLDEEMIARAPVVKAKLNLRLTQECLDRVHLCEHDRFKIDNASMYHILSKLLMDTSAYISVKQRKRAVL